eukprot:270453_1
MASEQPEERFLGSSVEIYIFVIALFLIIFSLSSCILLVYSLCKHKTGFKVANYTTITSAIFYFLSSVLFLSTLTYFNEHDANNFENDDQFVICIVAFIGFFVLAKLSVYSTLFTRLYSSFKGSHLALNTRTICIAITMICVYAITILWWMALLFIRYIILNRPFKAYYAQFWPLFGCLFICDCCLSWLVVGLFIHKLYKTILLRSRDDFYFKTERELADSTSPGGGDTPTVDASEPRQMPVLKTAQSNTSTTSDMPTNPKIRSLMLDIAFNSINETDRQRLNVITKQFILSSSSIITTQLCYLSFIILLLIWNVNKTMPWSQSVTFAVYGGAFYPIEVVCNCVALYLNYSFADKYYGFWCKCCHERCSLCVLRSATRKIVHKHSRELSNIANSMTIANLNLSNLNIQDTIQES